MVSLASEEIAKNYCLSMDTYASVCVLISTAKFWPTDIAYYIDRYSTYVIDMAINVRFFVTSSVFKRTLFFYFCKSMWFQSWIKISSLLPSPTLVIDPCFLTWSADWLWWWVKTNVSEPRPSLAYCSSPGWMWVESHGEDDAGWG
jgi:hypothetical protein